MAPLTVNPLLEGALWYAQNLGWKILPVWGIRPDGKCACNKPHTSPKDVGKHPILPNWQNLATDDPTTIRSWWETWPDANVAAFAKASGIFVVDVDPRSGGDQSFVRLEERVNGEIPRTLLQRTGNYPVRNGHLRGSHYIYKAPAGYTFPANLASLGLNGVDIKHNGYFLLYPSRHITGVEYEWPAGGAPWAGQEISEAGATLLNYIGRQSGFDGPREAGGALERGTGMSGSWDFVDKLSDVPDLEGSKQDYDSMLKEDLVEGGRAVTIYKMAVHLANKYGTDDDDIEVVISTLQKYNYEKVQPPLDGDELMRQITKGIAFVKRNPLPKFQMTSGFREADEKFKEDYKAARTAQAPALSAPSQVTPLSTSDLDDEWTLDTGKMLDSVPMALDADALDEEMGGLVGKRSCSDTGNGRRFVDAFGQRIRYTPGLGWFVWNEQYWRPDIEELNVREMVKAVPAMIASEASSLEDKDQLKATLKWANVSKSSTAQSSALKLAKTDFRIGVPVDFWDRDPSLIGVANGVVNLRTGELFKGRADLHITRRAPVAYQSGFESLPRFQEFLDFATFGDREYQKWLQRAAGYTITGLNTLDVLFLMYGPPGSGKNVIVEAIFKVLGSKQYAFGLDSSILSDNDGKSNQADMYHWAELRGRRMVWVDELPESGRIKENAVKKLTGSSEITGRSPGEKPITFESMAKLWITTNHRPIITDDAMWRRIRPIPWSHVPENPDPSLKQYLHDPEGGLPAILAWAVQGAIEVLNSKDPDPVGWCSVVADAAEIYRRNEDRLGLFLEEEFEMDVTAALSIKDIYAPYIVWSEGRTERPMSQIGFTRKLEDRGTQITGSGNRAIVYGYKRRPLPDPVAAAGAINWDQILRSGGM